MHTVFSSHVCMGVQKKIFWPFFAFLGPANEAPGALKPWISQFRKFGIKRTTHAARRRTNTDGNRSHGWLVWLKNVYIINTVLCYCCMITGKLFLLHCTHVQHNAYIQLRWVQTLKTESKKKLKKYERILFRWLLQDMEIVPF